MKSTKNMETNIDLGIIFFPPKKLEFLKVSVYGVIKIYTS